MTQSLLELHHDYYHTDVTKTIEFRKKQLQKLKLAIEQREEVINEALRHDLNKSEFEAFTTEVGFCLSSINHTLKHLSAWAKPPFKDKHHTEESKKKISEKLKGIPNSELQKQVTSKRLLGIPKSEDQKAKISKTKKERIKNGLIKKTYKKLYVFDLLKNEKTSYEGCKVFANKFNFPYDSVKFYARKNKLYLSRYILTYTAFIRDDDRKLGELLGSPEVGNQQPSSHLNG